VVSARSEDVTIVKVISVGTIGARNFLTNRCLVPTHRFIQWTVGAAYFDYGDAFQVSCRERVPSIPLALLSHAIVVRLGRGSPLDVFSPVRPCARILSLFRGSARPWDSHGLSEGFEPIHNIADSPVSRGDSSSYLLPFGQRAIRIGAMALRATVGGRRVCQAATLAR
jgi:hypothetical protein